MEGRYKVGEVMVENVVVSTPNESIHDCAKKMAVRKVGSVVVVEGSTVVGILTEQDVARKVVAQDLVARATPVSTVMASNVVSINPREEVQAAAEVMNKNEIKHLPVIANNELVGMITAKDVVSIEPILLEMMKFNNNSNGRPVARF